MAGSSRSTLGDTFTGAASRYSLGVAVISRRCLDGQPSCASMQSSEPTWLIEQIPALECFWGPTIRRCWRNWWLLRLKGFPWPGTKTEMPVLPSGGGDSPVSTPWPNSLSVYLCPSPLIPSQPSNTQRPTDLWWQTLPSADRHKRSHSANSFFQDEKQRPKDRWDHYEHRVTTIATMLTKDIHHGVGPRGFCNLSGIIIT